MEVRVEWLSSIFSSIFANVASHWLIVYLFGKKPAIPVEKTTILIVDDKGKDLTNPHNALKETYNVILAANIGEAEDLLLKYKPKYAFIDLELSGENGDELDGIELFKFIFEKKLATKPIVVSAHSFDSTKIKFREQLKGSLSDNALNEVLQDIEANYIDKLDGYNCILAIKNKIEILEQKTQNLNNEENNNGKHS
jgi:response regulator RpfG family c-di-GMP phosphodiesterase